MKTSRDGVATKKIVENVVESLVRGTRCLVEGGVDEGIIKIHRNGGRERCRIRLVDSPVGIDVVEPYESCIGEEIRTRHTTHGNYVH